MTMIQSGYGSYNTLYLSYDRDNFYTDSRKTTSSFVYSYQIGSNIYTYTYPYEIASSIQYWSFNYMDTSYSSLGTIRVGGAAKVVTPSGARGLGILGMKVELILYPTYKDWWWW